MKWWVCPRWSRAWVHHCSDEGAVQCGAAIGGCAWRWRTPDRLIPE